MNTFDKLGISRNGRTNKQFFNGAVSKATTGGIIEIPFNYSVIRQRRYDLITATIPGQFVQPTESIRTTRLDINFATKDVIRLSDGRLMKVTDLEYDTDPNKAMFGGDGRVAVRLTLTGGVPK